MLESQHLNILKGWRESHNKVKENKYKHFSSPQENITNKELSNTQIYILFSLQSRSIRGIKENFKNMHKGNTLCPICERFSDSQEHLLQCQVLQNIYSIAPEIKYSHKYGTIEQQKSILRHMKLTSAWGMTYWGTPTPPPAYQGYILGHSGTRPGPTGTQPGAALEIFLVDISLVGIQ